MPVFFNIISFSVQRIHVTVKHSALKLTYNITNLNNLFAVFETNIFGWVITLFRLVLQISLYTVYLFSFYEKANRINSNAELYIDILSKYELITSYYCPKLL